MSSLVDRVKHALKQAERDEYNAFIELYPEAVEQAETVERKMEEGRAGRLAGIIFSVKNNIAIHGKKFTCASRMLENYVAPYNAEVINRIMEEDGVIIGSVNMDEFACGSDGTTSAFGPTKNPLNPAHVPGGSSSGGAASVSAGIVDCSICSDTGGSIRCPSCFCGVYGLKPTYGNVSRYGLGDMAMSLDQIGPIASSLDVIEKTLFVLVGSDEKDETTLNAHLDDEDGVERVCVPKEAFSCDQQVQDVFNQALEVLRSRDVVVEVIDLPILKDVIPIYYLVVFAEFSSAMQKFDGLRYGNVGELHDYVSDSSRIRAERLGAEVKRRIMLGTFTTSKEQQDAWYRKALRARAHVAQVFDRLLSKYDVLMMPTMPSLPWKIGEKSDDPLAMYLSDVFTVSANLAGVPAMSVPFGEVDGFKPGVQLISRRYGELKVLKAARLLEG